MLQFTVSPRLGCGLNNCRVLATQVSPSDQSTLSRCLTKRGRVPQNLSSPCRPLHRGPSFLDPITTAGLHGRLASRKPAQTSNRLPVVQIRIVKTKARFIPPMLLLRTEKLPQGPDWLYEIKLDGYRILAIKSDGKVQLRSRNDNDFTVRYARIASALHCLPNETVIDGEVVALDEDGRRLSVSYRTMFPRRHRSRSSFSMC